MLAVGLVLILLLLGATYFATRIWFKPPVTRPPLSVLVTDFDNRTNDPDFDGALEQTLTTALETASFVTVYPRRSAGQVAAKLRPGTTRIDESMGRLISKSEGIGVIVTGAIERQGNGYAVTVRALDPSDEKKILAETRATATDKGRVLPIVVSLASGIRRDLGDTTSVAAGETFTAASLDAMRAFAQAQELQRAQPLRRGTRRVSARSRSRPGLRPRLFRNGRRLHQLLPSAREGRCQLRGSDETPRSHDRSREVPDPRRLLPRHRPQLREGDRELRNARAPLSRRRQRPRQPGTGLPSHRRRPGRPLRECARASTSIRGTRCSATTTRCIRCTPATTPRRSARHAACTRRVRSSSTPISRRLCHGWRKATPRERPRAIGSSRR